MFFLLQRLARILLFFFSPFKTFSYLHSIQLLLFRLNFSFVFDFSYKQIIYRILKHSLIVMILN